MSRRPFGTLWIFLLAALSVRGIQAEVTASVQTDVYVLPVAELASTRTYPDVITLQNDLIRVQLIPNRGRMLVELASLRAGTNFLYRNLKPDPMILPNGLHAVEFGGYYLSLPWNTRDRQPFDLSYEVMKNGPGMAEVYLSGKDPFTRTLTECWVRLRDASPAVEMEVALTNTSARSPREVEFKDFALFSAETPGMARNEVLLPVDTVEILASESQWLGQDGARIRWTESIRSWGGIRDFYRVRTAAELGKPGYVVRYPQLNAACARLWEPADFFTSLEVWSWGEGYRNHEGTGPYWGLSGGKKVKLQPQERISAKTYLVVLEYVSGDPPITALLERARLTLQQ